MLLMVTARLASAQVTFVIESLPRATPVADTIFICGNFNHWVTHDVHMALQRQLNGQLAITLPLPAGKYEYKFTRGSWTKVETNAVNAYNENRIVVAEEKPITVTAHIDNWLDLGGARPLNYIIFYFFACAFQGAALCLLVFRIQKRDVSKVRAFLIINIAFVVLLIMAVLLEIADQIWQTYFSFVFNISLFCWGPLVFYYLRAFQGKTIPKLYLYFIPAALALLLVIVRLENLHAFVFLSGPLWPPINFGSFIFISGSFVMNVTMYVNMFESNSFLTQRTDRDETQQMLFYFYWTSLGALLFVPITVLLARLNVQHPFIEDFDIPAVILSTIIFAETYFLWKYPEILREERTPVAPAEYALDLVEKLTTVMRDAKPYKKPDLTVSDLAEMLGTKPHALSRMINDMYQKNFRDFVNTYRIEEFIELANTKEYKHYTFLALAQEVGFNSKSTFNLAFKKMTNQSPRDYFKSRE